MTLPNILLVVFDTARADVFTPYNAEAGVTPTVGDLARRGTAFPTAVSTSNWTLPSHASLFTGLLPSAVGLTRPPQQPLLPSDVARMEQAKALIEAQRDRLLPAVLQQHGYRTSAVSANPWVTPRMGFGVGFERFQGVANTRRRRPASGWKHDLAFWFSVLTASEDDGAGRAESILRRWLAEPRDCPFFWFVNLMECHTPYAPPRPYNDGSLVDRIRTGFDIRRYQTAKGSYRACVGEIAVPEGALERMQHLYRRGVKMMDDLLGRLVEELEQHGLLDDTLIVVTSDHGENLGEGCLFGHTMSLDDRLTRVPLVMSGGVDVKTSNLVSLADVPRLIADAVGIPDHPWHEEHADGIAISQVDGRVMLGRRAELAEAAGLPVEAIPLLAAPLTAATDGRHKLVRCASDERLFDLVNDPLEVMPVAPGTGGTEAVTSRLRKALDDAERLTGPDLSVAELQQHGHMDDDEDADLSERLRALGYL